MLFGEWKGLAAPGDGSIFGIGRILFRKPARGDAPVLRRSDAGLEVPTLPKRGTAECATTPRKPRLAQESERVRSRVDPDRMNRVAAELLIKSELRSSKRGQE